MPRLLDTVVCRLEYGVDGATAGRLVATGEYTVPPLVETITAGGAMLSMDEAATAACVGCLTRLAYAIADTLGLTAVGASGVCCPNTDQPSGVTAEPIVAEVEIPPA